MNATTAPRSTRTKTRVAQLGIRPFRTFKFVESGHEITVQLAELDSKDAERLLRLNTDNRKLRKAKVDEYKRAIDRGDFLFNGDAIRISEDGVLLDGQHRLEALKQSAGKITVMLVDGLPPVARETIDVGATRTAANLLEFGSDRMKNAINVAALGRAAMTMEHPSMAMPSKQEVVHYVHEHRDELEQAYLHGHRTIENSPLKGGTTPYGLAAYLIGKAEPDQEIIRYFFRKLATGEGLFHGDPVLALRNRLVSQPPTTEGGSRSRYLRNTSLFLRAWNAWAKGKRMATVRTWGEGQTYPEAVPVSDRVRQRVAVAISDPELEATMPIFDWDGDEDDHIEGPSSGSDQHSGELAAEVDNSQRTA